MNPPAYGLAKYSLVFEPLRLSWTLTQMAQTSVMLEDIPSELKLGVDYVRNSTHFPTLYMKV